MSGVSFLDLWKPDVLARVEGGCFDLYSEVERFDPFLRVALVDEGYLVSYENMCALFLGLVKFWCDGLFDFPVHILSGEGVERVWLSRYVPVLVGSEGGVGL